MGYSTRYELTWQPIDGKQANVEDPVITTLKSKLSDAELATVMPRVANVPISLDDAVGRWIESESEASYALDTDGTAQESCKWYEHETDVRRLSKLFPNVLFTLHGEGEENDDIWNKYFLNGKMQVEKAKIQIAPFDAGLLK